MLILSKIYHDFYAFRDKSAYVLSEIFSWKNVRFYLGLIGALNASLWFFSWLFYRQVKEDLIILHYNVDFGVDLVGDPANIFVIPTLGLFLAVFNFSLLLVFAKRPDFRMISHLILAATVLANLFLSLSLGPLYLINFS
jgi:hypothetical protein